MPSFSQVDVAGLFTNIALRGDMRRRVFASGRVAAFAFRCRVVATCCYLWLFVVTRGQLREDVACVLQTLHYRAVCGGYFLRAAARPHLLCWWSDCC